MSTSIAESRQHLSTLIDAAQTTPQVITKRNTPVAVLVSPAYFQHSQVAVKAVSGSFYSQLMALRETYAPDDDMGLGGGLERGAAWARANAFAEPD